MTVTMPSATYRVIRAAIENEQQITCRYGDHDRELCPHIIGWTDGEEKLLAWQFGGRDELDPAARGRVALSARRRDARRQGAQRALAHGLTPSIGTKLCAVRSTSTSTSMSEPAHAEPRIGTAGWSIPRQHAAAFPAGGSHLERYAQRFNAVEINSSFYRPHRRATYERWAASVPTASRLP